MDASNIYIRRKISFAQKIGALVEHKKYPESTKESKIILDIVKYNLDKTVHGIIVQLPIPSHFNKNKIIESVDPNKDIDGLTSFNTKRLFDNQEIITPATTKGILTLLDYYKIKIDGKRVAIVGRSSLVGKPTALAFLNRNSTVVVCHSHTKHLEKITKDCDIIIAAIGYPKFITKKHLSKNQTIIDVGINLGTNGKLVGDTDYEAIKGSVGAISPVPGGVGPMTIVSIFQNLLITHSLQIKKK